MNTLLKSLAILFALNIAISIATADEPNIPASSWEHHQEEGVALAMLLTSTMNNNNKKSAINIYIKNISDKNKSFSEMDDISQVQIFYVNDRGALIPLRNYTYDHNGGVVSYNIPPHVFKQGEVLLRTIDISSDELALIKSHPVKCSFLISDQETDKSYKIESSSRQLTETSGQ